MRMTAVNAHLAAKSAQLESLLASTLLLSLLVRDGRIR
jgi:hypothetical protein